MESFVHKDYLQLFIIFKLNFKLTILNLFILTFKI